jgi:hypothetical protein
MEAIKITDESGDIHIGKKNSIYEAIVWLLGMKALYPNQYVDSDAVIHTLKQYGFWTQSAGNYFTGSNCRINKKTGNSLIAMSMPEGDRCVTASKLPDKSSGYELNLDNRGKPCIKFRNYFKEKSLEQAILRKFIEAVKEKGCELKLTRGVFKSDDVAWDDYEIRIRE